MRQINRPRKPKRHLNADSCCPLFEPSHENQTCLNQSVELRTTGGIGVKALRPLRASASTLVDDAKLPLPIKASGVSSPLFTTATSSSFTSNRSPFFVTFIFKSKSFVVLSHSAGKKKVPHKTVRLGGLNIGSADPLITMQEYQAL